MHQIENYELVVARLDENEEVLLLTCERSDMPVNLGGARSGHFHEEGLNVVFDSQSGDHVVHFTQFPPLFRERLPELGKLLLVQMEEGDVVGEDELAF